MKEYKVKWCLPASPENTFLSTELDNDSYDLVENEYSYDSFELVLPRQDLGEWCKVKTAQDTIVISDFSINNVAVTGNAIYQGNIDLGDYVQIEGEYFLVVSKSEVDGIKSANLSRNVGFTQRKQLHNATKYRPIIAYINGFFTPVGTEANIFDEDGFLVYMGVIESVNTSGKNVVISMDSIIKSLDRDYYYNYKDFYDFNLPDWKNVTLQLILEALLDNVVVFAPNFWTGLPEFVVERQIRENKLNPWATLLEIMKLRNAYIQRKGGVFYVNTITLTSPFSSSPINTSIYDKMDLEGGYNMQLASTFTKASCKFRVLRGEDEDYERVVEGAISGVTKVGEVIEVDVELEKPIFLRTGYIPSLTQEPNSDDEITYLLSAIAGVRGLVYGYVTLVTIPDHTYVIGRRYKLTEIEEENKADLMHFIPNSIDTVALCYSVNKLECKFIIIENIVKNPISPAIKLKATSTTQLEHFGVLLTEFGGGLYTDKETLEEARNPEYLYNYFDTDMNVQIMNVADYTKHTEGILYYVTPNKIEVDGASPFVVGQWYILEYNKDFAGDNYLMEHLRMGGGTI